MNLLNYIFPKQCIDCETTWDYLCKACKKTLIPHMEICPYCHKFSPDYKTCLNCKTNKENFLEWIIIAFAYTWLLKKLILKLKYFHKKDIWNFLSDRLILALQSNQNLSLNNSIITYVPSHRYRHYFIKWYNQSQILANKISQKLWIPITDLASKIRHTRSQAWLNRSQRLSNLIDVFKLNQNTNIKWNETIIIVDDITTTWSTINHIAETIKKQYPHTKIRWLVLGRSNK